MKRKPVTRQGMPANYETFCQKYLLYNFNGKRAYLGAFGTYHKESTAETGACQLLRNPQVKARIEELIAEQEEKFALLRQRLIQELSYIAFSDQRRLAEWGTRTYIKIGKGKKAIRVKKSFVDLFNSKKLSEADARVISEVSETVNGVSLKCHSKERAMDLLGKHLGLWDKPTSAAGDNIQMTVNVTSNKAAKLIAEVVEHGAERN